MTEDCQGVWQSAVYKVAKLQDPIGHGLLQSLNKTHIFTIRLLENIFMKP